ncbi:hypothetical protein GALMADRAFT_1170378 [Galerina marginata CBS 339.88]|uniref:Nephrocystin 3-like N-terminal domain-containing protein n=1 Tax=Galerina marginata (strain CBS 339.88) TaxID=685588 RepID=A0A067TLZ2_GALM3|nr:hypothetical protein GALMADRAFT_1170378 [Galerina marginata CBS 339.88]
MSNAMFHGSNVVVTGGTITQVNDNRQTGKVSIERLQEAAAPAAFHDSGDRRDPPRCHPNTRVAVQEKIMNWILGLDPETRNALIMWLHGPAGSGKSAIAQTIAEWAFQEKLLLTSYFFSRFDSTRNHERSLIATIAYQVTTNLPSARECILAAIDADPLIFTRSLQTQTHSLIVKPLRDLIASGYFREPTSMRLVIIDGLDECEDREGQLIILDAISTALQQYRIPLIFLIASRPEHDITHAFGAGYLGEKSTRLPLDHEYQPSSDIELFLRDKFLFITETHPFKAQIPPNWPTEEVLQKLVLKSSGQFIYAATVVKFVRSTRHRPMDRLDIVIGLRPAARDLPFAELDVLYHHIFSSVDDIGPVFRILILYLLSRHRFGLDGFLTLHDIEEILGFSPGEIPVLICDLASVITIGKVRDNLSHLYLLHASLEDFFFDKSRSKNLYIDQPLWHARFAHMFFQHVASSSDVKVSMSKLCYNIAGASPSVELRQEILDFDITKLLRPNSKVRNTAAQVMAHIKAALTMQQNFMLITFDRLTNISESIWSPITPTLDSSPLWPLLSTEWGIAIT